MKNGSIKEKTYSNDNNKNIYESKTFNEISPDLKLIKQQKHLNRVVNTPA